MSPAHTPRRRCERNHRIRPGLAAACALALAAVLTARPAHACTCGHGKQLQLPPSGASGVPLDARVFAGSALPLDEQSAPQLIGPAGPVAVTVSRLETGASDFVLVLTPVEPLQALARYEVTLAGLHGIWHFTTGDAAAMDPPAPPLVEEVDAWYDDGAESTCGKTFGVVFAARGAAELLLLDVNGSARLDGISGRVSDVDVATGSFWVGSAPCRSNTDADPGDRIQVRAASVDLAGNVSAWSDPVDTQLPDGSGCGCGAASRGEAAAGLLLLAVGSIPRRRRPRASAAVRAGAGAAAVVLAIVATPGAAHACTPCQDANVVQLPAPGADDVPLNARVFAGSSLDIEGPYLRLFGSGDPVEVRESLFVISTNTHLMVLTPVEPLEPRTTYQLLLEEGGRTPWTFTTGDAPDGEAPSAPRLTQTGEHFESGPCGDHASVELSVEGGSDLLLVDVNGHARVEGLSGRVSDARVGTVFSLSGCSRISPSPDGQLSVRVAAVDLAGNLSPWSEPLETRFPDGCGCGAASRGEMAAGLLLLAAWIARRRVP